MFSANQPAHNAWQRPDYRLCGIRAALAKLEVPVNDCAFDDLLRQLDAKTSVPCAEAGAVVRSIAGVRRARELRVLQLRQRMLSRGTSRGIGRRVVTI